MAVPSGLTLAVDESPNANDGFVRFVGYGTYTAADFYITAKPKYAHYGTTVWDPNLDILAESDAVQLTFGGLGFAPKHVRVYNTTDGTGSEWWLNANLPYPGYTQVAAGDKTAVAAASAGVSYSNGALLVDVTACAPITDDDEFIIECSL